MRPEFLQSVDELWPDPDRRNAALERLLQVVYAARDPQHPHRKNRGARKITQPDSPISPTQQRCLQAAAYGLTNEQICDLYGYRIEQVKWNLKYAQHSLRAKNRAHSVAEALRRGLID